jgi:glycosyltransferase involved in cell wall biosynthesis
MRICIITSSFPSGPDDIVQAPFLIDFIEGLRKRGHRVYVFTQDREGSKQGFLDGVQVRWFSWAGSKRPLVHLNLFNPLDCVRIISLFLQGRKALVEYLEEHQMEACLALWVVPSGYFARYAYKKTSVPYSVWALGSDIYRYGRNPILRYFMKRIVHEARTVYADGFDLVHRIEGLFQKKCVFLATTRTLQPQPQPEPQFQRKPFSPCRFLFVGRLEKVKGIDILLQAMVLLGEERIDAHLTVVGKGGLEEWARGFIEKRGLGPNVTMLGNVPDGVLLSLYASLDCVVIPSRSESIPLVFSEALSFDKEMIVADVGDLGRLGHQYGVADVIPPEDPASLKEAMKKRILQNREGPKTVGEAKRDELKRLFNMETSVERFLADYPS